MTGAVLYPFAEAREVLRGWRSFAAQARDEVTSDVVIAIVPPELGLPPELTGERVLLAEGLYAGTVEAGPDALGPLASFGNPLMDLGGPAPYCVTQSSFDAIVPDGRYYYWKSLYLDQLSDDFIDALIERAATSPSARSVIILRHLGGAIAQVPEDATAYGNRRAEFNLSLDSIWVDASASKENIAWTRATWAALERFSNGGVYQNFAGFEEEGDQLTRAEHRGNYERLMQIKQRYDPIGLFNHPSRDGSAA
jgi:hypothetical protein